MYREEAKEVEHQSQAYQQNIMLKNRGIISRKSDEEIRHARGSNDDSSSSDGC